ncbi:MAG: NFACT family protein [Clostridiales Family XIII bacterium]|jgi:predicted ribosome quality control (RQC) complex YloA/Tae2 family protein|nr:NFACT family protein [Clostridiales Family XIII bacterium]
MPFDNYVVGAVARELNDLCAGGRVERIYQPEREELILCINRPPGDDRPAGRYNVLLSANAGRPLLYAAESRDAGPQNPPAFCMLLRKYLIGARLISVARLGRERIVRFDFATSSELGVKGERSLLIELMGKHSNIIFCEPIAGAEDLRIVDAIKRVSADVSRIRQTLPGMTYLMPPPGKGISPVMAEETKHGDLTGKDAAYFDRLLKNGDYAPRIFFEPQDDGSAREVDFHIFGLGVYDGLVTHVFEGEDAVSSMLEAWYDSRETAGRVTAKANEVESALALRLDKLYLKKQRLLEDLTDAARAGEHRKTGDLITANIWRIEKGAGRVALEDYAEDGAVRTVDLDPKLTPAQNAQRYYKLYSKAKTSAVFKTKQLEETNEQIDYLESVSHFLRDAKNPAEIAGLRAELEETSYLRPRGKKTKVRPGRGRTQQTFSPAEYTLSSGAKIFVGRNNTENDELTFRFADKDDLWLHAKDIPGSHVILKTEGHPPAEQDLFEAAAAAAWNSKARASEGVPVDYTQVRYVKKPSGAKPGYVIFTKNRTLYVTPALPK